MSLISMMDVQTEQDCVFLPCEKGCSWTRKEPSAWNRNEEAGPGTRAMECCDTEQIPGDQVSTVPLGQGWGQHIKLAGGQSTSGQRDGFSLSVQFRLWKPSSQKAVNAKRNTGSERTWKKPMEVIAEDVTSDSGKSLRMEHLYENYTLALSWCYFAEFQSSCCWIRGLRGLLWSYMIHHSLKSKITTPTNQKELSQNRFKLGFSTISGYHWGIHSVELM